MIPIKEIINKTIHIEASALLVWSYLCEASKMKQWMLDDNSRLEIISTWKVGSSILIKGNLHGTEFSNDGKILSYESGKHLQYSHLSSVSKLEDVIQNYSILNFSLTEQNGQTLLELSIHNFPTESIYKHLKFYWNTALEVLKKTIESEIKL